MMIKKWIVASLLVLVVVGVMVYASNMVVQKSHADEGQTRFSQGEDSKDSITLGQGSWQTVLSKASWDLLDKKVSGKLAKKLKGVQLTDYQVLSVEPYEGWSAGEVVGGKVDIIMMNRETKNYDWLSFSLLVKDDRLVDANLLTPDYYKGMKTYNQQPERVKEFVSSVFADMHPNDFGYRYRTQIQTPNFKWELNKQSVMARSGPVYLVEVEYNVTYANQKKQLKALLIVRDYLEEKFQIEDMKVL